MIDLSKYSKFSDVVNLNVGGTLFTTTMETLKSKPDTRLSRISSSSPEYVAELNVYFFDRSPTLFDAVLDFYRTGELHLPKQVCGASIRHELEFWQIGSGSIADCCVSHLFQFEDELEVTNNLKHVFESKGLEYKIDEINKSKWNKIKSVVWNTLDKPNSSKVAKGFSVIYFIFVLITCITFILETHSSFRVGINSPVYINATYSISLFEHMLEEHSNAKVAYLAATDLVIGLVVINNICTLFFMIELFCRFVSCPRKKLFFKDMLNAVDLFIVLFMTISSILYFTEDFKKSAALLWLFLVSKGFIILRLFRLFRLAKHYSGLKILYLALRASFQELGLLFLTFMITTSLFGGLVFYAEFFTNDTLFTNVPIAIWWAIVTLTTVGYGDYYPTTPVGYVIGAICAMCGLLLLSMPIAIIATNFNDYYSRNKIREKQLKRKEDIFKKIKSLFSNRSAMSTLHLNKLHDGPTSSRVASGHRMNGLDTKAIGNGVGPHDHKTKSDQMHKMANGKGPPTIQVAEASSDIETINIQGPPKRFQSAFKQLKNNGMSPRKSN